ncbi:unnamed protein product [Mytilus coruscus]|uniref:LRAT domain-containing protein n=1 Tax=Mytilus coruscus TaxID=42192 RepID=A0A6J8BIR1_MYTCO|nr:unnamed protein product [Mytilus coruscus]
MTSDHNQSKSILSNNKDNGYGSINPPTSIITVNELTHASTSDYQADSSSSGILPEGARASPSNENEIGREFCEIPFLINSHEQFDLKRSSDRGLTQADVETINGHYGVVLQVGTGICRDCRIMLLDCHHDMAKTHKHTCNITKVINSFGALSEIVKDGDEKNYIHFKVKRKTTSSCCSYFHHFILHEVIENNETNIKVMVAHYTSSVEICTNNSRFGLGKFISQTIDIQKGKKNGLFDLESGLYKVNHQSATYTVLERLYMRLGERAYDFRANNCEHAVNHILHGKSISFDSNKESKIADICTSTAGDIKEVGIKVALIIALISSIAGSLTRYSYVRLMIAAVAARNSNLGNNETCSNEKGNNIIRQAINSLENMKHDEIPFLLEIESSEQIIEAIKASFKNPFICRISEFLARKAINKTLYLSMAVALSVETIFFITKMYFGVVPLFKFNTKKDIARMILLRGIPGYSSVAIGIVCGSRGQTYLSPPALCFSLIAFFTCLISRYVLAVLLGICFDCSSKRCKGIENLESMNIDDDQSDSSLCTCGRKLSYFFLIFIYLACFVGIMVPPFYFLD